MAEKRGVIKKIKNDVISMNSTLKSLDNDLKKLSADLKDMMNGTNGSGPYWNGNKAKIFYNKAVKNLANNIKDYNYAAKIVQSLAIQYEQAALKDN